MGHLQIGLVHLRKRRQVSARRLHPRSNSAPGSEAPVMDRPTCSDRKRSLRAISSQRLTCGAISWCVSNHRCCTRTAVCCCDTRPSPGPRLVGVVALEGALVLVEVTKLQQAHIAQRCHGIVSRFGRNHQLRQAAHCEKPSPSSVVAAAAAARRSCSCSERCMVFAGCGAQRTWHSVISSLRTQQTGAVALDRRAWRTHMQRRTPDTGPGAPAP